MNNFTFVPTPQFDPYSFEQTPISLYGDGEDPHPHPHDEEKEEHAQVIGLIAFTIILVLYIAIGMYMETKHFAIGHETGVIIIIGLCASLLVK